MAAAQEKGTSSPTNDLVEALEITEYGYVRINEDNERRAWPLLCAALHARHPRATKIW